MRFALTFLALAGATLASPLALLFPRQDASFPAACDAQCGIILADESFPGCINANATSCAEFCAESVFSQYKTCMACVADNGVVMETAVKNMNSLCPARTGSDTIPGPTGNSTVPPNTASGTQTGSVVGPSVTGNTTVNSTATVSAGNSTTTAPVPTVKSNGSVVLVGANVLLAFGAVAGSILV